MKKHCCKEMDHQTSVRCDDHDNPYECPDSVVVYSEVFDEYGLIIHDGGQSSYTINFCPFCGFSLPESKRDKWFDELEKLGFDSPLFDDEIPVKYKSNAWYKNDEK